MYLHQQSILETNASNNHSLVSFAGTFSNVYLARMNTLPDVLCALKHIIPTSGPGRVQNELKCLQDIG